MNHVIIRIDHEAGGQPRPYADSRWQAVITLDGNWYGKRPDFGEPYIKKITNAAVRNFVDTATPAWWEPKLTRIEKLEPHKWRVEVTQPYLD